MAGVDRQRVVREALGLLDEVGLDGVTTRRLAERLGIKQPSLSWHFARKEDLLAAMAVAAMAPHAAFPLPRPGEDWTTWFIENHRSLRRTLLAHRDGARLHAGTFPADGDLDHALQKLAFLVDAGLPEQEAATAMLTASRFTVGSALEQQADDTNGSPDHPLAPDHNHAFEAGLQLITDGLTRHAPL